MSKGILLDAQTFANLISNCSTQKERKALCTNKRQQLEKGYTPTTAQSYLTIYRKELSNLNLSTIQLEGLFKCLKIHKAKAQKIQRNYVEKVYKRTEQDETVKISTEDCDNIIEYAKGLLSHKSYYKVALGVLLLTGRRTAEILYTAKFEAIKKDKYKALFHGQVKKRGDEVSYNIPLLAQYNDIVKAVEYLQTSKSFEDIKDVHSKAANALMIANKESFKRNFPFIEKVHDLRKLYAAICYYKLGNKQSFRTYASSILGHSNADSLGSSITTETYLKFTIK